MNEGKRAILNAAHQAAQEVAMEMASERVWSEEGYKYPERKAALDDLVDAGFGRFFMSDWGSLMPVASGRHITDYEVQDSWYDWALFNMDEVKEYMKYRGMEDDELLSMCEDASGYFERHCLPGQIFSKRPAARVSKRGTRVLVTCYSGYDV